MYRLTIFVLVSCVVSERLVGARKGESPSGRSNLYFDSYYQPSMEEYEESDDGLRDAVLMQPEQVLDVPPTPLERDYDIPEPITDEPLWLERSSGSARDSEMSRNFFTDLLHQIQLAFSQWPPKLTSLSQQAPEYSYQFDSSLLENQVTQLKVMLAAAEEKACLNVVEKEESPQIIFTGVEGCSIEAVENKIVIGYDCFEPTMIMKLIFKLFGVCGKSSELAYKAGGLYIDSYRSKAQWRAEEDTDCKDMFGFCSLWAKKNQSLPCSSLSHAQKKLCERSCRLCGDSCVDYDPDCNTHDVLKDCLSNWEAKKLGCANTCGVCRNRRSERSDVCMDLFGCCEYYAKRGYCQKLPEVMKKYCPESCGYCKPTRCADLRTDCPELKKLGGCQKMADLMGKNCPRTCNMCGNGVENRDSEERKPPENCKPDDEFLQKFCSWNPFLVN